MKKVFSVVAMLLFMSTASVAFADPSASATGIGIAGAESRAAAYGAGSSNFQSDINVSLTSTGPAFNQTFEGSRTRIFPDAVQPQQVYLSPNYAVPYAKESWSTVYPVWGLREYWDRSSLEELLEEKDVSKGDIEITKVWKYLKEDLAEVQVRAFSSEEFQKNRGEFQILAKYTSHGGGDVDIQFAQIALKNFEKSKAPMLVVVYYAAPGSSSVSGWNIGFGGGASVIEGGPGRVAGQLNGGIGIGKASTKSDLNPEVVVMAVVPKGYTPPKKTSAAEGKKGNWTNAPNN